MEELIRIGPLEIRFLQSRHDTEGSLDMFTLTVPPDARVPAPHYHRDFDEVVYGLEGVMTWTVDGAPVDLGPGNHVFIRRGSVHGFRNPHGDTAKALCTLTPGLIGPEYFRDVAAIMNAPGPPDMPRVLATMERYGLIPVPE